MKADPSTAAFSAEDEEFFHSGQSGAPDSARPVTVDREPAPAREVRVLGAQVHRSRFIRPVAEVVAGLAVVALLGLGRAALHATAPAQVAATTATVESVTAPAELAFEPLREAAPMAHPAEPVESLMSCATSEPSLPATADDGLFGPPAPPEGFVVVQPEAAPRVETASTVATARPKAKATEPQRAKRGRAEPVPTALRLALARKPPTPKKSASTSALLGAIRAARPHS